MDLDLYGTNAAYGTEPADLSDKRCVQCLEQDGEEFPRGVRGLIPVVTTKKGTQRRTWAFPCGEVSDDAPAIAAPAQLVEAVELVNRLLDQAAELSGYKFGFVGGIQVGIPEKGQGYTRVQVVPLDAHGQPNPAPLRLTIETCDEPGAPWSLTAVVDYTPQGAPARMVLTEFADRGASCKVTVSVNEKTGKLSVAKVEEALYPDERPRLLYKRGWEKSHPRPGWR